MAIKQQMKLGNRKKPGRTIAVSSADRLDFEAAGLKPLTQFPMVPITVSFPEDFKVKISLLSNKFIDPLRMKPYGIAAVCRVLVAEQELIIDRIPFDELMAYAKRKSPGPGRKQLAEKVVRISLLIPKPMIDRINDRVMALNEPLIGTATVIRWLIQNGVATIPYERLYSHIPSDDMAYMLRNDLSPSKLVKKYQTQ